MSEKIKIFTISDHPLSPSGVGTQTKYIIEGMLKTGKYQFVSFGGAIKHPDHRPQQTQEWGEDWVIWPVDGYGNQDQVRAMVRQQKPDILWFMTDPRFYQWLWRIENEIRTHIPMVYYHVWDNYPYPNFNRPAYLANDHIACISKLTHDIVQTVVPEVDSSYVPHAVDGDIFKPMAEQEILRYKMDRGQDGKFVCFWNNRNARRKQSGTLTDLARVYNMADLTINISDAEGFGLATLESLSCGTPILVNKTGGLQDQITNGDREFGIGLEPCSKSIIGSQEVPYIYEDRISKEDFVDALVTLYEMGTEERQELSTACRDWAQEQFSFDTFIQQWDDLFTSVYEKHGSWDDRKNYSTYEMKVY